MKPTNQKTGVKRLLHSLALSTFLSATPALAYTDLWVFGDSFSDNGATTEIIPVLASLGASVLPENGKLSDDKIWIEYFAQNLGFEHRAKTYWNYNNKDAGNFSMIAASAMQDELMIIDFPEQVEAFSKDIRKFSKNDLVVIQMGINDALEAMKTFGRNKELGQEKAFATGKKVIDKAMLSYGQNLRRLVNMGARDFLVLNSPDLGAAPFARIRGVESLATKYSAVLNQSIKKEVSTLKSSRSDIKVFEFDLFGTLRAVLKNPEQFGLSANIIVDKPCGWRGEDGKVCNNPDQFFYFDLNHPTDQVNKIIGARAMELVSN